MKYISHYTNVYYIPRIVINFRLHDASKTVSFPKKFIVDNIKIAEVLMKQGYFKNFEKEIREKTYVWVR